MGALTKIWGSRDRKALKIVSQFAVLPLDEATATIYGDVRAGTSRLGRPLLSQDVYQLLINLFLKECAKTHKRPSLKWVEAGAKRKRA